VVARALSIEVTSLALKVCRTRRRDDPISYWGQAIVAVSGAAAEQRFACYPPEVRDRLWKIYWKTDRANAEHWLELIRGAAPARRRVGATPRTCAPTLQQCEAMARHLVEEHWPAIVRVARALAAEGELSGVLLDRLWRDG
jgi:hypothetical protein